MFETTIQICPIDFRQKISCDLRLRVVFILEVPGIGLRRLTQETTHTIACSLLPLPVTGNRDIMEFLAIEDVTKVVNTCAKLDWFKGKSTGNHGFYH
jgi:hypothetical protein